MSRKTVGMCAAFIISLIIADPAGVHAIRAPKDDPLPPVDHAHAMQPSGIFQKDLITHLQSIDIRPTAREGIAAPDTQGIPKIVDDLMKKARCNAREKRVFLDEFGRKHVRMGQFYKGLPIVGGELIIHHDPEGRVEQVDGKMTPGIEVDTVHSFGADVAAQIGLDEHSGKPELKLSEEPSLVVHGNQLAWRYMISHEGQDPGRWIYYVGAHTGEILNRFNNIKHLSPSVKGSYQSVYGRCLVGEGDRQVSLKAWKDDTVGNYFLYHRAWHWGIYNWQEKTWDFNGVNNWGASDRSAISGARNLFLTQMWVRNFLSRNSFDNMGGFARANVHYGKNYVNAYWDGKVFCFGDGDGVEMGPLVSLDVVAHEFGHALTEHTSNLDYYGESGALNESYSDIAGTAVEHKYGYQKNWLLGEGCMLSAPALRDMRNPKAYGQPSRYKGKFWYSGSADNAGVHTNSGVQNFAFYLLAAGGSGSNEGLPYNITALGVEAAARIAMRANMVYLIPTSNYSDSRRAWIKAATDLGYPVKTVAAVWDAVGVF